MKRNWSAAELDRDWSLSAAERKNLTTKTKRPTQQLGLAVLACYLKIEGQFPSKHRDVPKVAVCHVAQQLAVHFVLFTKYALEGRTAEADRATIRRRFGWRLATDRDGEELAKWLHTEILADEIDLVRLEDLAAGWFRERKIEPLTEKSLGRCIRTAVRSHETELFSGVARKISKRSRQSIDQLVAIPDSDTATVALGSACAAVNLNDLKADPARPGLESVFREVAKLQRIDSISLPPDIFVGISPKTVTSFRRRANMRTKSGHWLKAFATPLSPHFAGSADVKSLTV